MKRVLGLSILATVISLNSISLYAVDPKKDAKDHLNSEISSDKVMIQGEPARKIDLATELSSKEPEQATTLSQEQYNARMQYYVDQVKASKDILDVENSTADAKQQKQALCTRIDAYQNVVKWSQKNIQLDSANSMLWVANQFLQRQKESMEQSGMTLDQLCVKSTSDQVK